MLPILSFLLFQQDFCTSLVPVPVCVPESNAFSGTGTHTGTKGGLNLDAAIPRCELHMSARQMRFRSETGRRIAVQDGKELVEVADMHVSPELRVLVSCEIDARGHGQAFIDR